MDFSLTTSPKTSSAPYSRYRPVVNTYLLTKFLLRFRKQQEDSGTIQARNKEHGETQKEKTSGEKPRQIYKKGRKAQ
jgi:hypothetical protein